MKSNRPIPESREQWLSDITEAYLDAKEGIPFGAITGSEITETELFHLAPLVCLKFRAIKDTKKNRNKATEAALSSYVANKDANNGVLHNPTMAFAFCYILAHYGLDLLDDEECEGILLHVETNLEPIEVKLKPNVAN